MQNTWILDDIGHVGLQRDNSNIKMFTHPSVKQFLCSLHLSSSSIFKPSCLKTAAVALPVAGLFVDLGSHALDLLDFLLGPLQQLRGTAVRGRTASKAEPEDAVVVSFACGQLQTIGRWTSWTFFTFETFGQPFGWSSMN